MKIVLAGGSGQVGTMLARHFLAGGDEVVVLSRAPRPAPWRTVAWDAATVGAWAEELDGAGAVLNLAGRSVDCRYHAKNRRAILESRLAATRAVGAAVQACATPPRVWLQASTATIYAHSHEIAHDESGQLGGDEPDAPAKWAFSVGVAKAWEAAATAVDLRATRLVLMRTAMVMNVDRGSIFDVLLRLVRFGLGGTPGDGRQYVSWLHEADFVRAVSLLLADGRLDGPVNLAAPAPLPIAGFFECLRRAYGRRIGLPAARWMLELGAFLMRTETELVLKSRRVVPGKLRQVGFEFEFPDWRTASADLVQRWRAARSAGAVRQRALPQ